MKFLVDESLSSAVARLLCETGHDAVHVGDRGLLGAVDAEVMRRAAEERRVVISADTDFGELLALGRHPGISVVLLRRAPRRPSAQEELLVQSLSVIGPDLDEGALAVVTPGWVRVRPLPAEPGS